MMDGWLLGGGLILIVLGVTCQFRPDLIWRLYSLEPRWRRDHPTQPANWTMIVRRQGYVFLAAGVVFALMGISLGLL
jgi:hypothetical protein